MKAMDALDRLLDDHGAALRLYARQWVADASAADDVLQESLVACWQRDPGLSDTPLAYLFTVVRNTARNFIRGHRRRHEREQASVDASSLAWFVCPIAGDDRRQVIERALQHLPEAQREVVLLHLWGELSFAQVGEVVGCNANTAASRYRYALEALRQIFPCQELIP
jgi:RNA polymerase sigma-70 factor, ECF subfamily